MSKSTITIQRGEGLPALVEYDEFVLIGFKDREDGGRDVTLQASRRDIEGEADMLDALKTIANAMEQSENSTTLVLGNIINQTLSNGLEHLAALMEKGGE